MINNLKNYFKQAYTMQLATTSDSQPWVCTVYFVDDEKLNLYWLSLPSRRHSAELETNSKAAVAIQIKTSQPVIGVQSEGEVSIVTDPDIVEAIMKQYVKKYKSGNDFYSNFLKGKNHHKMYVFTPNSYVLFDEMNSPNESRREIKLSS